MTDLNHEVAKKLREIASLLVVQQANPFRSRAYFNAADSLDQLPCDIESIMQDKGVKGLIEQPAIGVGIAQSIYEYIATGRMTRLENLQGNSDPVSLFQSIPTVDRALAQRIHTSLHVDTLEALENEVRKGGLDRLDGLGSNRKLAIAAWLAKYLGDHRKPIKSIPLKTSYPSVELLLTIDAGYRDKAAAGKLPLIAPKRFNPENKAWLPVLHKTRDHWHFTAMYSNTERAQKFDRIIDCVVIYVFDDHHREGQFTVVTETKGELTGKRVVRGRELECFKIYGSHKGISSLTVF